MSITATCPECGEDHRLDEKHAGRRIRCRECGEPVDVPGERPRRKRDREEHDRPRRAARKRGSGRRWILVGSIAGGLLLVVGLLVVMNPLQSGWRPDPSIADRLTEEYRIGAYVLSAPPQMHEVGRAEFGRADRGRSQIRLVGPDGSVWITIQRHESYRTKGTPEIVIGDREAAAVQGKEFVFPQGEVTHGTLDGIRFVRAEVPHYYGNRNVIFYVAYDDDAKIEIHCLSPHGFDDERSILIDGVARSFRRAE